jgi:hypothetical protein
MGLKRAALTLAALLTLAGCADRAVPPEFRMPQPGDTVVPQLFLAEPWKAGQTTPVHIRLRVQGPGTEPYCLRIVDVPEEHMPRVALTFFRGEIPLGRPADLATKPDC